MKRIIIAILCLIGWVLLVNVFAFGAITSQQRTLEVTFSFIPPEERQFLLSGYSLRKNGAEVCEVSKAEVTTSDPTSSLLRCAFVTEDGTFDFTLVAEYSDNTYSPVSFPFAYTISDSEPPPSENQLPQAIISATPSSGECPLTVALDGSSSSDSDGTITNYNWDFGDGSGTTGAKTDYTFNSPGTYPVTLQVTDNDGGMSEATQTVACTEPQSPENQLPQAIIGATPSSGECPLTVALDGSSSSDSDGTIASYSWSFGDGTSSTGATTDHTFSNPGTHSITLQVTDNEGGVGESTQTVACTEPSVTTEPPTGSKTITYTWDTVVPSDIKGFRMYMNDTMICETSLASATMLSCNADLIDSPMAFSVTSYDINDVESAKSNILVLDPALLAVQASLTANFTTTPLTGEAPLKVTFDASGSTGDIDSYSWSFGDGTSGLGPVVEHIYSVQGTYTAILTVTDKDGATDTAQFAVAVEAGSTDQTPPSAVISSSNAVGDAPLGVSFDGSGSDTTCQPLAYSWDFGDGQPPGSGEIVAHTYFVAGTYSAELTVSDCNGLTDTVGTPVIVTSTVSENQLPTAKISATPISGECPLTVDLDGSSSSDSDGTISKYNWNFGDGTSTIGSKVQHTFNNPASYTITLQVTDDDGGVGEATQAVMCVESQPETGLKIEVGELTIADEWATVSFEKSFANPVVVAGPPSFEESDPVVVQIRNVSSAGFEIRLKEWKYLDDSHRPEKVSYVVLEQGTHTLNDGNQVEAGYFNATTKKVKARFQKPFVEPPVVLTTISSENDGQPATGRIYEVSSEQILYSLQEEEKEVQSHPTEKVAYIAWTPGVGVENGFIYEAGTTPNSVRHQWYTITMKGEFISLPFLLSDMQTRDGRDPAALRYRNLSMLDVEIKVEEEQSKDTETEHGTEVVGYLLLGSQVEAEVNKQRKVTFSWDFDSSLESTISGFRVYKNGEILCEELNTSSRTVACETMLEASDVSFMITVLDTSGQEIDQSNTIQFTP